MEFIEASKVPYNAVQANDFEFYKELDHVIQKDPIDKRWRPGELELAP